MTPIEPQKKPLSCWFTEWIPLPLWKRSETAALSVFSKESLKEGGKPSICNEKVSPPKSFEADVSFFQAPVNPYPIYSEEDKFYVGELLKTLDESNLLTIGVKMFRLAEIGSHIGHVHPFTFLKIILTDAILKGKLERIFAIAFKRLGMMNKSFLSEGFGNQLEREKRRNNLEPYIEEFCTSLGISKEEIRPFIQKSAWTDLSFYFLKKASPRVP